MRLLLDQGLPRSACTLLRELGWVVDHVGELDMGQSADSEILAHARQIGALVITLDSDFHTILAFQKQATPSVLRFRIEGMKSARFVQTFIRAWGFIEHAANKGAAITITETQIRIRNLPFEIE